MSVPIIALFVLVVAQVPEQSLPPWGSNHHPTDVARRHVEPITNGRHAYVVRQGGTMDGTNCRPSSPYSLTSECEHPARPDRCWASTSIPPC